MDIKLTDIGVRAIAEKIVCWKPLRPHLGLTKRDEVVIKCDNNERYEKQKEDLVYRWWRKMGDDATPRMFVAAAHDAGDKELADEVEKLPFATYMYGDNLPMDQVSDGMRHEVINVCQTMMIAVLVGVTCAC